MLWSFYDVGENDKRRAITQLLLIEFLNLLERMPLGRHFPFRIIPTSPIKRTTFPTTHIIIIFPEICVSEAGVLCKQKVNSLSWETLSPGFSFESL
jgi:hypothetical protein